MAAVVVLIWHRPAVRIRQELMNYLQKYQKFLKDRLNKKLCKKFNFIIDAMRLCGIMSIVRLVNTLICIAQHNLQQKGGQEEICQMSSLKRTSL